MNDFSVVSVAIHPYEKRRKLTIQVFQHVTVSGAFSDMTEKNIFERDLCHTLRPAPSRP
jgi:hypothetical protein